MILATSVALWVKAWLRTPSGIGRPHCDIIVASVYVRGEQGVWNGDDVGREDDRSPRWETNGSTVHVVLNRGSLNFASLEYSALNPVLVFFFFLPISIVSPRWKLTISNKHMASKKLIFYDYFVPVVIEPRLWFAYDFLMTQRRQTRPLPLTTTPTPPPSLNQSSMLLINLD
ncbi:unnamed protein product [Arctogadus glacialis]